jgi:hypothetical protein
MSTNVISADMQTQEQEKTPTRYPHTNPTPNTRSRRIEQSRDCVPEPGTDPTTQEREFAFYQDRYGQCIRCKRYFNGLSAFDKHQAMAPDTPDGVICMDPATRGLIIEQHDGFQWWTRVNRRWADQKTKQQENNDDD